MLKKPTLKCFTIEKFVRILIASKHLELLEFNEFKRNLKIFDQALLSLPINLGQYGSRAHNQGGPGNFRGRGPKQGRTLWSKYSKDMTKEIRENKSFA